MSAPHDSDMDAALLALIRESLALWGCAGAVRVESSGAIAIEDAQHTARISRAEPGVPFRWSIVVDGRSRVAGSVTGLLRALRLGVDADFRPSRVRIAPLGKAPP